MNLRSLAPIALLPLLSFLGGCSNDDERATNDKIEMASSSLTRDLSPDVPAADAEELRAGNTAFATELYTTLRTSELEGKNIFFSPLSISTAIAMIHAGARGDTESQIASALHFTLPQARLHPALNALDLALSSRKDVKGRGEDGSVPFKLNVVNSSWADKAMSFVPTYLDTLATNYGAGVRLTDFARDSEGARKTINGWVEDQTNDKIKDLLPQGSISADTRLVLVNAVYFNAGWDHPFEASATSAAVFHGKSGDANVPTMHQNANMGYAEGDGWRAAELTFASRQIAFDVIVPDAIDDFEGSLDAAKLASIAGAFQSTTIQLALPKFKIEGASFSLKAALEARGVIDAFKDGVADFSGISGASLYVSDVLHQAFVSVEEKGVEAAAATAAIAGETSAPADPKELNVDKPFLFLIRDVPTGAVIFVGRVLDLQ